MSVHIGHCTGDIPALTVVETIYVSGSIGPTAWQDLLHRLITMSHLRAHFPHNETGGGRAGMDRTGKSINPTRHSQRVLDRPWNTSVVAAPALPYLV
jgi:hypothetical protein